MISIASSTRSLGSSPWGKQIDWILSAALEAADPEVAVRRTLQRAGNLLTVAGLPYDLDRFRRVLIVGAGKAGLPMARAAVQLLRDRLVGGLVIVKEGYAGSNRPTEKIQLGPVSIAQAGHPVPDERGVRYTRNIIDLLKDTRADDLVICLISGGGSALLISPAPGLTLANLQRVTAALLASGAGIEEINALRKHLDTVKGGGLANLAAPAQLVTLILSDVIGDPLDIIASGPTVPDPNTYAQAYAVLERFKILNQAPMAVIAHLQKGMRGEIPETPKPGEPLFEQVQNVIIGSNRQAAQAAIAQARSEGLNTLLLTTYLQGEARQAGRFLASIARQIAASGQPLPRPACIIAGGETTVTLVGDGRGGRNQELALGAVQDFAGLPQVALLTLATDGGDGLTPAAGAVVSGETAERARQAGLDPLDYLRRNDSYTFFSTLGDLLLPGPTQTNVNDLAFLFAF